MNSLDTVQIKDLRPGLKNFSITCIVLEVGNAVPLKENREVRTVKVADSTACVNLSLWDEPGALISPGDIIRLSKAYVGTFRNALTLFSTKNGDIDKLGEFCLVFNEQLNMSDPNMTFANTMNNQPGSGMAGNMNNKLNNGNMKSMGMLKNRPSTPLSSSQVANDRKNSSWYSADRGDREPTSNANNISKPASRGGVSGGHHNDRSDKR